MGNVRVHGNAMAPALEDGDRAFSTASIEPINRGDVVGFRYPHDESKRFVMRVVGLPGERIQSVGGKVSINGQDLAEPYVADQNRSADSWGPVTLGDGEFFVLGDNRRNSSDSRHWGRVRRAAIWAKVLIR